MKPAITIHQTVLQYGADVICSSGMQAQKQWLQHGQTSVFAHCVKVACLCVYLAGRLHIPVDRAALIKGALLHDYFLYDWHIRDAAHRLHGFTHAKRALENAQQDFNLGLIERDMIVKHMFPLNLTPPKYRESVILCLADKICAVCETLSIQWIDRMMECGVIV